MADELSFAITFPGRDEAPCGVVALCFAVLREVVVAVVRTAGFVAVHGVDTHELAEVHVIGNTVGVFENLVEVIDVPGNVKVFPELFAQFADIFDALFQVFDIAGHAAREVEDVAEFAVEIFWPVGVFRLDTHQLVDALLGAFNGVLCRRGIGRQDLRAQQRCQVVRDGER